ncbi:MAG: TonB-dependent receptor [Spongiibacteraceae bacterium]
MRYYLSAIASALLATHSVTVLAGHDHNSNLEDVLVTAPPLNTLMATSQLDAAELAAKRAATNDAASLLRGLPGVSLYGAGGVSSLPVLRGLGDDRLRVKVDGMDLISACGNHMNPALSYIDPANVDSFQVFAGITPVSVGGDSIGGTIIANSKPVEFSDKPDQVISGGSISGFYRSNGDDFSSDVSLNAANDWLAVRYSGAYARADNYQAGDSFKTAGPAAAGRGYLAADEVGSSEYESQNHRLGFALKHEHHLFNLDLGFQHIPYQGFPNQRMDMTSNKSSQISVGYKGNYDNFVVKANLYKEKTRHTMDFGDDKLFWYGPNNIAGSDGSPGPIGSGANAYAAGMPMDTRGENIGATLAVDYQLDEHSLVRAGIEAQLYTLDDWWDPSGKGMWPNTLWNINNGERDRYAVYSEWQNRWSDKLTSLIGLRYEQVHMDTDEVQGYNPMYAADAAAFNASNRSLVDDNFDASLQLSYAVNNNHSIDVGLARKTRSPNLYERFAWSTSGMAMRMVNMAGDGNGYVGNLELEPEVSYTASIASDWHDAKTEQWQLVIAPYITRVKDYIDATICTAMMCQAANSAPGFRYLTFTNDDARLYGVDISGFVTLSSDQQGGSVILQGVVNYLEAENTDTDDNLYNIMPLNATFALVHSKADWTNTVEWQVVAAKEHVSAARNEINTAGYSVFNLRSAYNWTHWRVDIGVENLFDRGYDLPLGGAYLGQGKTMSPQDAPYGVAVPGVGRSFYAGLSYTF